MRHPRPIAIAAFVAALAATACSDESPTGSSSPSTTPEPTPTATETPETTGILAHLVPSDRRDVEVVIGFPDSSRSPLFGADGDGEPDGALPDLATAAIDLLGLSATYQVVTLGEELDMLEAADLHVFLIQATGVDEILDRTNTVTFLDDVDRFIVRDGLEIGSDPRDLCGLRVGYQETAAGDLAALTEFSAACTARYDLEPIDLRKYTTETGWANEAATAGDIDAAPSGEFYGGWLVDQHPGASLGGPVLGEGSSSFLVGKNTGLAGPLSDAIDELVANGTYERIMTEHGLPSMPPEPSRVMHG